MFAAARALMRGEARARDLLRAVFELAWANRKLARSPAHEVFADVAKPDAPADAALDRARREIVGRVAFAIPRVAARLPWRADCMVQALAAQRWLAAHDIASSVRLGVRPRDDDEFEAHAWLTVGEAVVTGGDISPYSEFRRS